MLESSLMLAINTASSKTAVALLERTNSATKNLAKSNLKDTTNNFTNNIANNPVNNFTNNIANNPVNNLANNSVNNSVKNPIKILAEDSWQSQNDEAEKLMPAIAKLFKKAKKPFSDIKEVFVVRGPGSFTGLRVGITVANTIAYLNQCDLFAISTFEYWHTLSDLPVLIFAGKGGVYLSENSDSKHKPSQPGNPQLVNLPDLNKILAEKNIKKVFGDISNEQKNTLTSAKFVKFSETFGEVMRKIIQKNIQNSDQISTMSLAKSRMRKTSKRAAADLCAFIKIVEPLYIKKPGITQIKKCYT